MYICVDLDSTLLRSDGTISDYTLKILKKCQELGHKIIINTARNYRRTIDIFKLLNAEYMVCNAGAQIFNKNLELINFDYIPENITDVFIKEIKPDCKCVYIQTADKLYTTDINEKSLYLTNLNSNSDYLFKALKILVYLGDFNQIKNLAISKSLNYSRYENGPFVRISPKNVNKLNALKLILIDDNSNLNEVISFGDDDGDIDFLKASKISVLMKNGLDKLKKEVTYVCDSNDEDGIAKFLKQFFHITE